MVGGGLVFRYHVFVEWRLELKKILITGLGEGVRTRLVRVEPYRKCKTIKRSGSDCHTSTGHFFLLPVHRRDIIEFNTSGFHV